MKITVLDGYGLNPGDLSWKGFEELGELTVYDRTDNNQLSERAKDSDVLITNKTVLNAETISSLPKLRYIGVLATGYNVVDTEEAHKRGIAVTNIPAYSTMSVAQRVFAFLLSITDRVEHYALQVSNGKWTASKDFCYWDTNLTELAGKYFGIVGYGNIGQAVARIALAFGMNVLAVTSKEPSQLPEQIKKVSLDELWKESDIISLHCPLTPDTSQIINQESIAKMKPGVILINTGRGGLVNETAVATALTEGKIGAFCADVLSTEPPLASNPLLSAPNAYITPHIAWATKEARQRLMNMAVDNLKQFMAGKPVNLV
ncbi:MAG: D-2-hydroxyacid dehydrogenase [Muribaculaceae bacterium]|nr:D-2-hydroxyacid dehydrogenase [Muribaculaceae bacterium]